MPATIRCEGTVMSKSRIPHKLLQAAAAGLSAGGAVLAAQSRERKLRGLDEKKYSPPGAIVNVNGRKMHVRTVGSGANTVVMMPGLGTDGPCLDFYPLAELFASRGMRAIIPEPFGYGFSDDTNEPRSALNIINEIRCALAAVSIDPPYCLLGHSVSGFYIRIWAHKYPDEVSALIAEDISLPEQIDEEGIMNVVLDLEFQLAPAIRFLDSLGMSRAVGSLQRRFSCRDGSHDKGEASGKDQEVLQYLARRQLFSKAICGEYRHFRENAAATEAAGLPDQPILVLVATGKGSASQLKFKNGFSWLDAHHKLAEKAKYGRAVEIPGAHYLHASHAELIADETADFLGTYL